MPSSLDFNWQDGDAGSGKSIAAAQTPAVISGHAPVSQIPYSRRRSGSVPWGYLLLLAVGVTLGMVLGFVILTVIGQYRARADFTAVVALEHQALVQDDRDLYNNLFAPEEQARQEVLAASFPIAAQIYDIEDGAPKVRNVHLLGESAEVDIEYRYDGQPYQRLENLRQVDGQWRISRTLFPAWGDVISTEVEHVTVTYRARDDFLVDIIPKIEETTLSVCKPYSHPEPCRIDITIQPDGDWPPNIPVDGVGPLSIISPRLVGMNNGNPHPLWWLALRESIAETLTRRSN